MDTTLTDVERFLKIGLPITFDSDYTKSSSSRFETTVVGWKAGEYIVLETERQQKRSRVLTGNRCVLRFLRAGRACAARVESVESRIDSAALVFCVSWPKEVQYSVIRSEERFGVDIPCEVEIDEGCSVQGELKNVSLGGCQFYVPIPMTIGRVVRCTFKLSNDVEISLVQCTVRHVTKMGEGTVSGCSFTDLQKEDARSLQFYITATEQLQKLASPESSGVLVLDADTSRTEILGEKLRSEGVEFTIVTNTVRAFTQLGIGRVAVFLVDAEASDIPLMSLISEIRNTRSCRELPIFVYGGDPEVVAKQVEHIDGSEYIPSLLGSDSFVGQMKELLQADAS